MSALMCTRCPATAMPRHINGLLTDPSGWACLTLTGRPIVNRTLCPGCTEDVRALLVAPPDVLERHREIAVEEAFSRGYTEGRDDALTAKDTEPGQVPA